MKFSVFTASTPEWSPEEAAKILAAQGWDGIEWRITDQKDADRPGFWAGNRANWLFANLESDLPEIARITAEAGLGFPGLGGYARCDDHKGVERMLAATAALGARQVRVTTLPTGGYYPEVFAATRAHFDYVAERAAYHGVKALVELHKGTVVASASAAVRLLGGLDPAHVGVIHDVGNLVSEGFEDYLSGFQMLGDYLAHVHAKNNKWVATSTDGEGIFEGTVHWMPQAAPLRSGQADLVAYFRALKAVGYDDWVTVEDFSTERPLEERTADNLAYLVAVHQAVAAES
jgi:sugar phosphate isomerase/epimerase